MTTLHFIINWFFLSLGIFLACRLPIAIWVSGKRKDMKTLADRDDEAQLEQDLYLEDRDN